METALPCSCSWGRLTFALVNRVSSIVLPRQGAGPVYPSVPAVKGVSFLTGWRWLGKRGGHLSLFHATALQMREGISFLHSQGWLTHIPICRVNSTVPPRGDAGLILPSVVTGEGLGQVPYLLQVLRGEGRRASFTHPCYHLADERSMTCSFILTPPG